MFIEWITSEGVFVLAEGSDRSVGKRCGPDGFAAPLTVLGEDTPTIDAEWQRPQERGNRTNRVSFSVSIELATIGAALAMVSQVKRIPSAGVLLTIDDDSGTMVRYEDATLRSIDPRQRGVAVDVVYTFACGEDVEMGSIPGQVSNVTATKGTLQVALAWTAGIGATSYQVWAKVAGSADDPEMLADGITDTGWTHVSGDTVNRTYWIISVRGIWVSEGAGGVNGAGQGS